METKDVKHNESKVLNNTSKSNKTAKKEEHVSSENKELKKMKFTVLAGLIVTALSSVASTIFSYLGKIISEQNIFGNLPLIFSSIGLFISSALAIYIWRFKKQYKSTELSKKEEFQEKAKILEVTTQEITKLREKIEIQEQIVAQNKNAGIISIIKLSHDFGKNPPVVVEKLKNARYVKVFFNTGKTFFANNSETIREAAKMGKTEKVQVLIASEKSKFLEDIEIIEKKAGTIFDPLRVKEEIDGVRKELDAINSATKKETVEIRYFDTEYRISIILIESVNGEKWGWLTLALPPVKTIESIAFEIEKNDKVNNIYNLCENHFNAVWEKLKPG